MTRATRFAVFDYRLLRFIIGVIALILTVIGYIISDGDISSINASYYTDARGYFLDMLFIVAAFQLSYNGNFTNEDKASKVVAVAAAWLGSGKMTQILADKNEQYFRKP